MIVLTRVSETPLDVTGHMDAVAHDSQGATALFVGTVRDNDPDAVGRVARLEYSAHPDADAVLAELAASADAEGLRIAVSHRIGSLAIGDAAIVCAVSSVHRAEAFDVCRALVESVKAELPVWKKQIEADGSYGWVGLGRLA
ncbi:molybdenum cofactor biosynthesis protein MoaE [Paramicrobacterium chengjingii]|uniref:Molybdenum cofactor biosynthesis protein MoaE n=1 Tax=Paramicrobacterium chengjingii TaxID=2769067 RepID=A0ABX6YGL6_9MICO|nr:molybdenum cofactor biosynthesis protein MoaE [Microbacterium chengjingii]QPZ37532.1 molybdenum cofactor biosynthesis protein MoaE [Microbacterium chengjingii]